MTDREKRLEAALKAAANSLAKGAHDNESGYLRKAEIAARVALCNPHSWGQHGFCVNCNSDRLLIEKTALPTEPAPDAAGVIKRLKGMAAWDHDVGKLSGAVAIAARDALALIGSLEHDLWVASLEQRPTDLARAEATAAKLAAAEAERDRLQKQLPESMQHCTILFKECEKGHGWLTATNWIQHGCPTCERERAVAVTHWAQAVLTALNVGDVCKESPLHLKLREVMIAYREGVPHAD